MQCDSFHERALLLHLCGCVKDAFSLDLGTAASWRRIMPVAAKASKVLHASSKLTKTNFQNLGPFHIPHAPFCSQSRGEGHAFHRLARCEVVLALVLALVLEIQRHERVESGPRDRRI
eukprot:scaffold2264_cov287-Pinguiococcus_pyrenoidosus.AAC.2